MIVIFVDNIENFFTFLEKRVMNEVFYEFKEIKLNNDLLSKVKVELILTFLSKVEEFIVLYETKLDLEKLDYSKFNKNQELTNISKSRKIKFNKSDDLINELQKILGKVDPSLTLIKGKIREIFLSYSS